MSGRFVQYLPLLASERVAGIVIIAGAPASPMELPEEVIADWVGRSGDRRRLHEIPLMFAIKPDPALLEEWADDAVKASRYALEATLRLLLTPFQQQIADRTPATPVLVLAGTADALLGPTVQRAIAAKHPGSQVIELDCAHEFLMRRPARQPSRLRSSSLVCRVGSPKPEGPRIGSGWEAGVAASSSVGATYSLSARGRMTGKSTRSKEHRQHRVETGRPISPRARTVCACVGWVTNACIAAR